MKKNSLSLSVLAAALVLAGCDGKTQSINAISCDNPQIKINAIGNIAKSAWDSLTDKQKSFFKNYDDFVKQNHITLSFKHERKADSAIPGEYDGPDNKFCVFSYKALPVLNEGKAIDDEFTAKLSKADDGSAFIIANPKQMKFAKSIDVKPTTEQSAFDEFVNGEQRREYAQQQSELSDKAKTYRTVPLSDYHYVSSEQLKLAYVANNPQLSDDKKMTLLSDKYRNSADQFTKNDLVKSDLPRLLAQAEKYKAVRYIKYIVSDTASKPAGIPVDAVYLTEHPSEVDGSFYLPEKYDLTHKTFSVEKGMGCEASGHLRYSGFNITSFSNAYAVIVPKENVLLDCKASPTDEAQAREWSKIFTGGNTSFYQIMYVAIDDWKPYRENGMVRNNVRSFLTHVDFHYIGINGTSDLISGQIN
ncbi:hypothetical protein [Rosenbergiella nectarea]|uniref:hypothetical protein n=1 Tax=Rosenbergiella nectarea TaxID=988801 RepID=UPI001BD947F1|nr:hypothetical protein [Rosenbergiella nectarea]MBT0729318.1 hypothetical protein [Rosenbergiella nectarea subsp. apis]